MSIFREVVGGESGEGRCRKTISERLNSDAMDCFWACVKVMEEGTWTTATGLPV